MKNIKLYDNIKNLFKSKSELKKNTVTNSLDDRNNLEHGFQLLESDAGTYLKNFLSAEQLKMRINNINNLGYMDVSTGNTLRNIINDKSYDTYVKSVHSSNVDSIMEEGIRCLGTTSSQATTNPDNIKDISLQNTITKVEDLTVLVELTKKHNGLSQGFNAIDGTMILQIPKNTPKEELFCYNENSKTYNIKPDYIIGFIPVDEKHNIKGFITSLKEVKENKTI